MPDNKQIWEEIAAKEAYFGVSTHKQFRTSQLDGSAKEAFFESGRRHIEEVWERIQEFAGTSPSPERALDYGCGVGRLLLPLAKKCESVVGVDISEGMLAEAAANLDAAGVSGHRLQRSDEFFAAVEDRYDFVHSYIVLQHIEPSVGYQIIRSMLERLDPGGFGMIHVTHTELSRGAARIRSRVYRAQPWVHRVVNAFRTDRGPFIPMYSYDMARVSEIINKASCSRIGSVATDHGYLGEMIFLKRAVVN